STVLRSWNLNNSALVRLAMEGFFTFFQRQASVYGETILVLKSLRERGIPCGILTDVPYGMPRDFVQRDLTGAKIAEYFDAIVTSVEAGVRKPEPAGYFALAAKLGAAADKMLYVGNEPKDVIGARNAGLISVLLDRAGQGANHGQQFTIS